MSMSQDRRRCFLRVGWPCAAVRGPALLGPPPLPLSHHTPHPRHHPRPAAPAGPERRAMLRRLAQRAKQGVGSMGPVALTSLAWGLATLGQREGDLLDLIAARALELGTRLDAQVGAGQGRAGEGPCCPGGYRTLGWPVAAPGAML